MWSKLRAGLCPFFALVSTFHPTADTDTPLASSRQRAMSSPDGFKFRNMLGMVIKQALFLAATLPAGRRTPAAALVMSSTGALGPIFLWCCVYFCFPFSEHQPSTCGLESKYAALTCQKIIT